MQFTKNSSSGKASILGFVIKSIIGLGFILVSPLTPDYIFNFGLILVLFSALISWYSFVRYLNKWIV